MDCTIVQKVTNWLQNVKHVAQNAISLMSTTVDTERNLSTHVDITPLPSMSMTLGP
jgi:hypothetical protein